MCRNNLCEIKCPSSPIKRIDYFKPFSSRFAEGLFVLASADTISVIGFNDWLPSLPAADALAVSDLTGSVDRTPVTDVASAQFFAGLPASDTPAQWSAAQAAECNAAAQCCVLL